MTIFEPMTNVLPEGQLGLAKIEHFTVSPEDSRWTALRGGREWVPLGRYAKLYVGSTLMMSDTRMEQITNYEVVSRAKGNVLIAGLGLGMILIPILRKRDVYNVVVVEKYQDVIDLVVPAIKAAVRPRQAKKLQTVRADIFDWRPAQKGRQFDTIYFDIWSEVCTDNLEQMATLRRAFAQYLCVGGWASCWRQEDLRQRKRNGW